MTTKTIKINTIGINEKGVNALDFFLEKYYIGRYEMVSEEEANVFIINMDHVGAKDYYSRIQKNYPNGAIVLTAIKPVELKDDYFLPKPIVVKKLLEIMGDIEKRSATPVLSKRPEEAAKKITVKSKPEKPRSEQTFSGYAAELLDGKEIGDSSRKKASINFPQRYEITKAKFTVGNYFLGAISQAHKLAVSSQKVVKLSGLWRPIYFFPETNEVYVDLSKSQLRSICVTSIIKQKDAVAPREIIMEKTSRGQVLELCHKTERFSSVENFLWKVALYTSRGRVPDFVDIKQDVVFSSWPNITRLDLPPDSLKIITYWSATSSSLEDTVNKLGIERQYVFSLYTAMYILGHIAPDQSVAKQYDVIVKTDKAVGSELSGLFSKVIAKLKFA